VGSKRWPLLWVGGALVVVVALAVVFTLAGGDDQPTVVQAEDSSAEDSSAAISQTNDVAIDGMAIPEFQETETAQGLAAPQVSGSDFDGESVSLLEPGTPTVVGFFAHWCPHCQAEVDELSRHLATTGLPDDVNVVAVSTGVDSDQGNFPPSAWFESEGWPTPVLSDDAQSSAAKAYGLSGFPFWAIVDADGNLVSRTAGGIGADQLDAFIELARASA
jgi:cytochrome c biogenesis protein CcmG/thiol:disulfide interchange protein DsbE